MLKIALVACAACAGGGTAMWWLKNVPWEQVAAAASEMPSITDLNYRAHAEQLPDRTVKEPF